MRVNQRGEPIYDDVLGSWSQLSGDDLQQVLFALLDHLGLEAKRTNATKHGLEQIVVGCVASTEGELK